VRRLKGNGPVTPPGETGPEQIKAHDPLCKTSSSKDQAVDTLHEKARRAIESGEKLFNERAREAAEYLAEARELGAKQQQSASAIGKSAGWVNALLKWHDGGYKTVCPFPRAARRIQPAERKTDLNKAA
jgi:hypothetical protein